MPISSAKAVQRELEQGKVAGLYWLVGPERLKARELVRRITASVRQAGASGATLFGPGMSGGPETLEGTECDAARLTDDSAALMLGGGLRVIIVQDAHAVSELEQWLGQLPADIGSARPVAEWALDRSAIVIGVSSRELDGRKKSTKLLQSLACIVPCEEVREHERAAWIRYLAERDPERPVHLDPSTLARLERLEPWSLEGMEQELAKLALAGDPSVIAGSAPSVRAEQWLEDLFSRRWDAALRGTREIGTELDVALPLLGLAAWNLRQLLLLETGAPAGMRRPTTLAPFVYERLVRWRALWSREELLQLQSELTDIDRALKQSPLEGLGLWASLVTTWKRRGQPELASAPAG